MNEQTLFIHNIQRKKKEKNKLIFLLMMVKYLPLTLDLQYSYKLIMTLV